MRLNIAPRVRAGDERDDLPEAFNLWRMSQARVAAPTAELKLTRHCYSNKHRRKANKAWSDFDASRSAKLGVVA